MRCAAALSTSPSPDEAVGDLLDRVAEGLGPGAADLAVAFASEHHAGTLGRLAGEVMGRGVAGHVIGCTGEAIVGEGREVEDGPALCLWAVRLPARASVRALGLAFDGDAFSGWDEEAAAEGLAIALGDPFSFPADAWLKERKAAAPAWRIVGGMASAAQRPGGNRLVLDDRVFEDGAVVALIEGPVPVRHVVSQGCRPIGRPFLVTRSEQNLVRELGRRPALEVLRELFAELDPEEQALAQQGLHLGRVINEYQESFGRGDFLVRNVVDADDDSGAIAVNDAIRVGQTVQFHVRDADTADEDLRALLAAGAGAPAAGALLFSCNGRGTRLFPAPDHDAAALVEAFGPIPIAGFFAMGEIGPVGGQNFLHGFTASVAVFHEG